MAPLRVSVLGPLRVERGGAEIRLGPRQARLLCLLVLELGRPVPAARLVRRLWGDAPPGAAAATLRSHVSHLRRVLDPGRDAGVVTSAGTGAAAGYRLDLPADRVDAHLFAREAAEGARLAAAGAPAAAAALLGDALGRWRGAAYADVGEHPAVRAEAARLAALRRAARCSRAEALAALGRHAEVVGELTGALAEDPYDEGIRRLLALALYRESRVDEAAALCRDGLVRLRRRGIDAPALAGLQRQILRREVPEAAPPPAAGPADVPCLLPPGRSRLAGRSGETAAAVRAVTGSPDGPAGLVVTGAAGIGKTALAVGVGRAVAGHFPDGQLYAELRGADGDPAEPAAVLGDFLRALGVRGPAVPAAPGERRALYRTLLARRRVLVVLDDAADAAQVRDLLPAGPGCAAIVTGRSSLAGLDGTRLALGGLSTGAALGLLRDMVGADRLGAEPEAAETIVRQCGRLPLAVWVAGARLAARPQRALAAMARALADERRRLDELTVGDVAVRASVELTYRGLPAPARRALRLLGLLPGRDMAAWAVAALLDVPPGRAERLLDDLLEVHLVEVAASGVDAPRYRLHDLVRLFAAERAAAEEEPAAGPAALGRVLGACLDLAHAAEARLGADFLGTADDHPPRYPPLAAAAARLVADPLGWFDREHGFLAAAVERGLAAGVTGPAAALAAALTPFFQVRTDHDGWRRAQTAALRAALSAGDAPAALRLHRGLGELDTIQDRYPAAVIHFEAALRLGGAADPRYEAAVGAGLAYLYRLLGRYDDALAAFTRAAGLARRTGNLHCLVYAAAGIGVVHLERGEPAEARRRFAECLRLSVAAGYRPGEAQALRCLGRADRVAGDDAAAAAHLTRARGISAALGDRLAATHAACWLGEVDIRRGRPGRGRRLLAESLWVYREFGNAWGEAATLRALAVAQLAAGRPGPALARAARAVAIWRRIGAPYWLGYGLDVRAAACAAAGDRAGAEGAAAEAAALWAGLGVPPPADTVAVRDRPAGPAAAGSG